MESFEIEITSERLVLRKPTRKDIPALVELLGNWEVAKQTASVPYPFTEVDAELWLTKIQNRSLDFNIFFDDDLIGGVGLMEGEEPGYELGYWIGEPYWGNGYASEACKALIGYAEKAGKIEPIRACYYPANEASARVLRKFGFEETGKCEAFCVAHGKTMPSIRMVRPLNY